MDDIIMLNPWLNSVASILGAGALIVARLTTCSACPLGSVLDVLLRPSSLNVDDFCLVCHDRFYSFVDVLH